MRKHVAIAVGCILSSAAEAQVSISGTSSQVTTNPAAQFDPSISGDIVVYTDRRDRNDDIYFTDLATGSEVQVTSDPEDQRLHDVSDGRIVFTDYSGADPQAWVYDIAMGMSAPLFASSYPQLDPTIDGAVVAFEAYRDGTGNADIAIADVAAGTYTALTATPEHEGRPTIGGSLVVYERGAAPLDAASSIVVYDLTTGVETVLGVGLQPHTDGRRVAWWTGAHTEADIVVVDTLTGASSTIAYAGAQTRPRLSDDVLAFDDNSAGSPDVVLRHLPTGAELRIPGTSGASEFLNDIDGNRLAYTTTETGNFDVFVFEFTVLGLEQPPVTGDPCESTSGLVEVFSEGFTRQRGEPELETRTFTFSSNGLEEGVVVIENDGCASAVISLNGEEVLAPEDLDAALQCRFTPTALAAENVLEVELRSKPGCEVTVTVYAVAPIEPVEAAAAPEVSLTCDSSSAKGTAPLAALGLLLFLGGRRRRR